LRLRMYCNSKLGIHHFNGVSSISLVVGSSSSVQATEVHSIYHEPCREK
jgi:hypothetical protein